MSTGRAITALVVGFLLSNILTTIYYIITASMNTVPFQREQQVFIGLFLTHLIFHFWISQPRLKASLRGFNFRVQPFAVNGVQGQRQRDLTRISFSR